MIQSIINTVVGYHNKGYPNQNNKNAKEHTNYNHQGLGRKFRLGRPLRASDASSDSPDPSGPRTQVPTRPTPQGLGRKFRLARSLRASDASSVSPDLSGLGRRIPIHQDSKTLTTRRPYPRRDKRDDSHTAAGQGGNCSNHPGHCSLTSFHCVPLPLSLWRIASQ